MMAQYVSDATISIVTDDEDDSENEIYSRTEPETESVSAERPMIGRRDRSPDRSDGQSDASKGLLKGIRNGKPQHDVGVSRNGFASMETGSSGCLGTSLSPTTIVILCLLVAAFPVHFPSVLLPDIRFNDVALRMTVCLAIVGTIVSSMTIQLALKTVAFNFRLVSLGGCVGVTMFAVIRCFLAVPVAVLGCASFAAGFLLTGVRVATVSRYCRPASTSPSLLDVGRLQPRRRDVDASTYLACGLLILACSSLAPFISASLYLLLLATDTDAPVTSLMTSSVTSFPPSNATLGLDVDANLSSWSNISIDINSSTTATPINTSSPESTFSSDTNRLEALSVSYVVCSLGALVLVLTLVFDGDDRHRKDTSQWSVSGVARLVLGPLNAFRRQDVALLSPLAVFVGAQQLFAYFAYIEVS